MYTLLVIDMQPGFLQRFDDYKQLRGEKKKSSKVFKRG